VRLGIIDDLGFINLRKYWDEKSVRKEASKYTSKSEFQKGSGSAYDKAKKLGIIDDLGFQILGSKYKRMIYAFIFTKNNAVYVGLTYNQERRKKQHFKVDNENGRASAVKIFRDETGETPEMIKLTDYLPKEEAVLKENEFVEYYRSLGYKILNRTKTGALGGNVLKWTEDNIHKEASKYKSKSEFQNGSIGAYGAALRLGIIDDLGFTNLHKSWDEDSVRKEATKYNNKSEFKKGSVGAYEAAVRLGIINDLGFVPKIRDVKWDEESLRQEASKYKTKSDFQNGSVGAYNKARKLGIIDNLGFVPKIRDVKWDEESLRQEASKYSNKTEFNKRNASAYTTARRLGILDTLEYNKNRN
jgi:predicted GIY-YIG superfamily endonuclease